jgi:hypothetical protein
MNEEYRTQCNVPVEIEFELIGSDSDDIEVSVDFSDPSGAQLAVPAFWAGGDTWKVRYASPLVGDHWFSGPRLSGRLQVEPYEGENGLFLHGPLRATSDRRHLEHADGTPFFWLGDTWWMGLTNRLHWPHEFKRLAEDRVEKGFNVVQIVAGLYPDMGAFDPRGANEAGFPWEADYARIRPEYFDEADRRLKHLVECGLTPCILGAWGYYLPWMGVEKMKRHWRYLIARYASWPVVWCAAGEANMPWYLAEGFPYDDREQVHGWTEVLRHIRSTDPFRRLSTIHPATLNGNSARHATDDESLLDFDMLQTPHGQAGAVPVTVKAVWESFAASPRMPVINGEAAYEMLFDSLPTRWTRTMCWLCLMNGAAGHTYGANGIWQCNRREQPHGASPTGRSWGEIPWDDAMKLPGSSQMAEGKRFLETFDWTRLEPHPEWACYEDGSEGVQAAGVGGVRLVYAVDPLPVVVKGLEPGHSYSAQYQDPAFEAFYPDPVVEVDRSGNWICPPPPGAEEDWLLVVKE